MNPQRVYDDVQRMRERIAQRSHLCDLLVGALARGDSDRTQAALSELIQLEDGQAAIATIRDHLRHVDPGIRARLARLADRTLGHHTGYHWVVSEALRLLAAREARGR